MNGIQKVVVKEIARFVSPPITDADVVDLDADLHGHYGLSSLNMILLMTSVCEKTETPIMHLTEEDLAGVRTPRDIVILLARINKVRA